MNANSSANTPKSSLGISDSNSNFDKTFAKVWSSYSGILFSDAKLIIDSAIFPLPVAII